MRRAAVIVLYTVVFWIAIPCLLLEASAIADGCIGWEWGRSTAVWITGILITSVSAFLLAQSVIQFRLYAGEWPISALPCERLVQKGLYSAWRHPIYLFYTVLWMGIGLLIRSPGLLLLVVPAFAGLEALYILMEERILVRRFGRKYINHQRKTGLILPPLPWLLRTPLRILFTILFRYRVLHRDCIPPEPPFFVVSAHRDYLDPFFIGVAVPFPVRFITTFEVFRNPVSAFLFRKMLSIPRKRYRNDAESVRRTIEALNEDSVIGIFPEGERSWTGESGAIKPEALKLLAKYHSIPVLPVRLEGNYHAWPRWAGMFRRVPVRVVFQNPVRIDPRHSLQQVEKVLAAAVHPEDRDTVCRSKNRAFHLNRVIYRCPSCRTFDSLRVSGGISLECRSCGSRFDVTPEYRIQCPGEDARTIGQVYRQIKITAEDLKPRNPESESLPFAFLDSSEKGFAQSGPCTFFEEEGIQFRKRGSGRLWLTSLRLVWAGDSMKTEIPLSEISSVTVESNRKLQVYERASNALFQTVFETESALKWQDWLSESAQAFSGRVPNRT